MGTTANRITKAATSLVFISMISKFLGLLRESVMAAYFGANYLTDAYRIAFEIPSILTGIIYAAITITFIPVYSEFKNKTSGQRLYFVNNLFNIVTLLTAAIAAFGMIFAPALVKVAAPGFSGETFDLSVKLTVLLFPSIVFLALAYLANGFLQANRSFAVPASMGISLNLIIILSIFFFYRYGIKALAIGSFFAMISQFAIQLPFMVKAGFRFRPVIDFKEPGLRRVLVLSIPVFISTAFNEAYIIIDKMLASGLSAGSISVLDYANKVNGIAHGVFFASLGIVFFPELSLASDNLNKFGKMVTIGLKIVILTAFPVMVGLWVLRLPIIRLLFERGEFDSSNTFITSAVLGFFAIGIIGSGLTAILNKAFYSLKDTKTPMINGILAICTNIILSLIFVRLWGVCGLALASSLALLLCGFSLVVRIRKKVLISYSEIGRSIVKSAVAAAVMGVLMYLINSIQVCPLGNEAAIASLFFKLVATIGIGVFVYMGVLYGLKTEELIYIVELIRNKFSSRNKLT
ncbi:MAG TPA: murein biosynthesis integral membrane protein MurJ [Patescibacteria group bacterium]|nr:murein biosynthesis integral membrane protein MurJ [Patescibacteria group bacterium]